MSDNLQIPYGVFDFKTIRNEGEPEAWVKSFKPWYDGYCFSEESEGGAISFRIGQPLGLVARKLDKAAADGQMQSIVKAYECWAKTGDDAWMARLWPAVRKAVEFCWVAGGWDADRDGVMESCQHNTMDVNYYGPSPQSQVLP